MHFGLLGIFQNYRGESTSAWAKSKKEAEQSAAFLALQELDLVIANESGDFVLAEATPLTKKQ